jgi:pimeloyl-ACP methyl ester carboxylesterase
MADHDYVVLLHGITKTARIMRKMESYLTQHGYEVYNDHYRSTQFRIQELAKSIHKRIQQHCPEKKRKIHFVGHSMGGLIIREIISKYRPQSLGRVIMIGSPNKGSTVVDLMRRFRFYEKLFGPAGIQMGTDHESIIHELGEVDFELGVIAGSRTIEPWFSWFVLNGPNDGKVSVESTKLDGMQDHIVIKTHHHALPNNKKVMQQTLHFLQHGKFQHR